MDMLGKGIENRVIVKLEEYTPFDTADYPLLAGGDVLEEHKPIYSYVHQHLSEAANEMLLTLPLHRLNYKQASTSGAPDSKDNRTGSISLPGDYLRLHTLRMSGWVRPVHKVVREGDAEYALQFSEWTRGTKQKPVVAESNDRLSYYSVDAGATHNVSSFLYIPRFDEKQEYDDQAAEAIALHCARKVCEVFGITEQITILTNEINSVLENMRL